MFNDYVNLALGIGLGFLGWIFKFSVGMLITRLEALEADKEAIYQELAKNRAAIARIEGTLEITPYQ